MSEDDKEVKNLIQQIFEKTNTKVGEDDPSIALVLGIRDILKSNIEDYEEKIAALNQSQLIEIKTELEYSIAKIQAQLDGANEYYVGNSTNHARSLDESFEKLLTSLDTKNKDLNFILAKVQAEYDKSSDERFERHIAKLEDLYAKELERQHKTDTSKQREMLFAGAGFAIGIAVCLLLVFIVR